MENIQGNVYNHMRETFIKNWRSQSVLGVDFSEDIPNFNHHDISESNMKCEICIRELWHDIKNRAIEIIRFSCEDRKQS